MIKKQTFNLLWTYWLAIAMAARDNPLRKLADAIEGLSSTVNSENPHLKISDVVQFGRLSTPSIFFLGIAFKFADLELQSKVLWSVNPYNYLQLISSITMFLKFAVISLFFIIHYSNSLPICNITNERWIILRKPRRHTTQYRLYWKARLKMDLPKILVVIAETWCGLSV